MGSHWSISEVRWFRVLITEASQESKSAPSSPRRSFVCISVSWWWAQLDAVNQYLVDDQATIRGGSTLRYGG
jgi:hypothetical protein